MKSFVFLCVFLISFYSFIHDGMCQTFVIPNATHPDYPGRCFYNESELIILRKGEKKRFSKQCILAECRDDYRITGAGCGTISGVVHCKVIKGDLSKPYPHCCNEYIC